MKARKVILWMLLIPAAGAALGLLAFTLFQDRLLFDRRSISAERLRRLRADRPRVEELVIPAADGVRLHGWLVKGQAGREAERAPLLIYFGGNGEEASWMAGRADRLAGWTLLLVNYRSYGLSEGRPGEKEMLADALRIYDTVIRRADIDRGRVAVMGRSIGTGVAVHLARERDIRAAVLVSPYDSITAVARDHFPFLPVSLLLRHRFESAARASGVTVPLLALVASEDRVIAPERSFRLAAAWAGPAEVRVIEGTGHNSIDDAPEFWERIGAFLATISSGGRSYARR